MEKLVIDVINHLRKVSHLKVTRENIDRYLKKSMVNKDYNNYDINAVLNDMIEKGFIDNDFKILNNTYVTEENLDETNHTTLSNTPFISSQTTPLLSSKTTNERLHNLEAQIEALKQHIKNHILDTKEELSLIGTCKCSNNMNSDIWEGLNTQISLLKEENSFLRNELLSKQKIIELITENNSNLIKTNNHLDK